MPTERLKSYHEALAQYHLHPEAKFYDGDYLDCGATLRRHIVATAIEHIGKEANRWEEQLYLGLGLEAQIEYGTAPSDHERILEVVRRAGERFGQRKLASASNTSRSVVSAILCGKRGPTLTALGKLYRALPRLEQEASGEAESAREVLEAIKERCQAIGVRRFAKQAGVDAANLTKVLSGRRRFGETMRAKLEVAIVGSEPIDTAFDQ